MRKFIMLISAVYVLFLIKIRWPKNTLRNPNNYCVVFLAIRFISSHDTIAHVRYVLRASWKTESSTPSRGFLVNIRGKKEDIYREFFFFFSGKHGLLRCCSCMQKQLKKKNKKKTGQICHSIYFQKMLWEEEFGNNFAAVPTRNTRYSPNDKACQTDLSGEDLDELIATKNKLNEELKNENKFKRNDTSVNFYTGIPSVACFCSHGLAR